MEKLVTLKLGPGSIEAGFSVTLQMGEGNGWLAVETAGALPPAPELVHTYERWQAAYRHLGAPYRLEAKEGFATNVSLVEDCRALAEQLKAQFNQWLRSESFRPLQDKLLEKLSAQEPVRFVVQTQQTAVQRLPWSDWELCDRLSKIEIAFSAPSFEQVHRPPSPRQRVRVLAVLGHSEGIDVQTDQALLNHLPGAEVVVLAQPDRPQLNQYLWQPAGWDILFFAGHSHSYAASEGKTTGRLFINPAESLTIAELKYALKKALERGLQIALFNSCDGLGLAQSLADLQIPQVLVMREPVPDLVAHEFLKAFLDAFARGEKFYLAVREARERLHGLEGQFPCATWLPVMFQNPAEQPPTWATLARENPPTEPASARPARRWALAATLILGAIILGMRQIGLLQTWELSGLDLLMALRPLEKSDPRLVVITVTEADIQAQNPAQRRGSLSDAALSTLLEKLEPMQPRLIGLDIYRDFPVMPDQPQLAQQLATSDSLIAVCKASSATTPGIAPPQEVALGQVGFSDFVTDRDQTVRRHLLALTPEPTSPCRAAFGFSALLALNYLDQAGVPIAATAEGTLQAGDLVFEPIEPQFGGYQGIDPGGHQIMLNYRRLPRPEMIAESVTLGDVLEDRVDPAAIRDRIVIIGTTAESFGDFWQLSWPLSRQGNRQIAGVFMQAQMTSQLLSAVLDGRPLITAWPQWGEALWILGWVGGGGLVAGWAGSKPTAKNRLMLLLLAVTGAELLLLGVSWQLLVQLGLWVPWVPAAIALPLPAGVMAVLGTKSTRESSFHPSA